MTEIYGEPAYYEGIGQSKSIGKRDTRLLVMLKDGEFVSGTVKGNELGGGAMHPMLLSDPAQGTLGVCKDHRTGIALIRGKEVEVFKFKGTGLKGICISGDPDGVPYQVAPRGDEVEEPLRAISADNSLGDHSSSTKSEGGIPKGGRKGDKGHELALPGHRPGIPEYPR